MYVDADMAKKCVDCVKIIQWICAMMEDKIQEMKYIRLNDVIVRSGRYSVKESRGQP